MELSPELIILGFLLFIVLVMWASRCEKCRKLFVFDTKSRWKNTARFLLVLVVIFFIGLPIYDVDVLRYPNHFQSYLEKYAEFLLNPYNKRNQKKSRVKVSGGNWEKSYSIEEFDGKKWNYKECVKIHGEGSLVGHFPTPPPTANESGEAVAGQIRSGKIHEKYGIEFEDLNSGEKYLCPDYVFFYRISDKQHCLKNINAKFYAFFMNSTDSWKALLRRWYGGNGVGIFVEDKLFNEVNSWPDD